MPASDLGEPLTNFLSTVQAARLTPSAKRLTKEGMLNAMNSYAGGQLVGGLDKADILSIRDAFKEQQAAVLESSDSVISCCCCCAAADSPPQVGRLRTSAISDVGYALSMSDDRSVGDGPPACCCCCI